MIRRACLLLASLTLVLSGCGTDDDSPSGKESDMTPDEAYAALEKVSLDLLEEVAKPGTINKGEKGRPVPCGGPGGNERTKVKYSYVASARAQDPASAIESAERALVTRRLRVREPQEKLTGTRLAFTGDGYRAGMTLGNGDAIAVDGETECLDNPDQ